MLIIVDKLIFVILLEKLLDHRSDNDFLYFLIRFAGLIKKSRVFRVNYRFYCSSNNPSITRKGLSSKSSDPLIEILAHPILISFWSRIPFFFNYRTSNLHIPSVLILLKFYSSNSELPCEFNFWSWCKILGRFGCFCKQSSQGGNISSTHNQLSNHATLLLHPWAILI